VYTSSILVVASSSTSSIFRIFDSGSVPQKRFATALLALALAAFVAGGRQRPIHHGTGIFLHPRNDVVLKIDRDAALAMPKPFTDELGVNAVREQVSGMATTMEPREQAFSKS
jgi:hypothetical protein